VRAIKSKDRNNLILTDSGWMGSLTGGSEQNVRKLEEGMPEKVIISKKM
jgi:hypothetical protein